MFDSVIMRFSIFSLFGLVYLGICAAEPVLLHRELDFEGECCDSASSSYDELVG